MKKFLRLSFAVALFSVIFCAVCAAEVYSGTIISKYMEVVNVNNAWSFDSETGVLTVTSNENVNYNETGKTGSKADGSWYDYRTLIKKVVLDGNFRKVTNGAFSSCTSLEEIVISENTGSISYNAFSGCTSLTTVSVKGHKSVPGLADLRYVDTLGGADTFKDTALTELYLNSDIDETDLAAENIFPAGITRIYSEAGSYAETYAEANNIAFDILPANVSVSIMNGSKEVLRAFCPYGKQLEYTDMSGNIELLFTDSACTDLYDYESYITENTTLYSKDIMSCIGYGVRIRGYAGIRMCYEYFDHASKPLVISNGSVSEVGVLSMMGESTVEKLTLDTAGADKVVVFSEGALVGKLAEDSDNSEIFAASAVSFEDGNGSLDAAKATAGVLFRGYIKVKNNDTGAEYVFYTDSRCVTLKSLSERFLASEGNDRQYTDEIRNFVRTAADIELAGAPVRYTKAELEALILDVYNSDSQLIVGEELGHYTYPETLFAKFTEAGADLPALLGVDLTGDGLQLPDMIDGKYDKYLGEFIDYYKKGGILTFSSHMSCPNGSTAILSDGSAGQACRGTLESLDQWMDIVTEGTALNAELRRLLNAEARLLRDLKNNGVPVLWRPFHEMNGSWFWWNVGRVSTSMKDAGTTVVPAEYFVAIWQYAYDYYVNELGLNNLIWVYSPNIGANDADACYPGDDFVDVAGLDWYSKGSCEVVNSRSDGKVDYNLMMAHGKPVAITEFGGSGDYTPAAVDILTIFDTMKASGMKLTYVLGWANVYSTASDIAALMNTEGVISLSDMAALIK